MREFYLADDFVVSVPTTLLPPLLKATKNAISATATPLGWRESPFRAGRLNLSLLMCRRFQGQYPLLPQLRTPSVGDRQQIIEHTDDIGSEEYLQRRCKSTPG